MGGISTDAITNTDGRLLTPMHDLAQSTGLLCRQSAADTTISDTLTSQLIFVFHRPSIIYQPKHTKVRSILKGSLELRPLLFKPETFLVVLGIFVRGGGEGVTEAVMLLVAGTVPSTIGYPFLTSPMY